ncbi:MAG: RNA polymerase sigma factor [Gemmatimonas sp.]|jgi:RNA polymerase sigma-70 factor (ECF subfamily)|uniref:RNA polymerase sigma factor n=1 Tax=Gemmatimonas sp. TaxID=1962908 RepID=UPI00391EEC7D|nr:sigma-70 family RNA polymerase sigma factor [Gemmatimonadota bacterium]
MHAHRHDDSTPPPLASLTDAELLDRLRMGDPAAERQFYERHVDRVYRLILRMCGRPELAQEWTQDTFLRAFNRLDQFRGDSALASWLHAIAVSVTRNGLRTHKRREAFAAPLDEATTVAARTAGDSDPDLKTRLKAAIAALPEGTRRVFVMHDVEGFTHEEISDALGCAIGTSKSQLFRAREKLRAALAAFAPARLGKEST